MTEDVIIHGARIEASTKGWWLQLDRGWYFVDTSRVGIASNVLETDLSTRPVRVVTPDLPDREASLLAENASLRDELDQVRGLSAEQEIRARALTAAVDMLADDETGEPGGESEVAVRWVLTTANRFAAFICDGRTPDEAGLPELGHHEGYRDDA